MKKLLLIIVLFSTVVFAQNKSIHQLDQEKYGIDYAPSKFDESGKDIIPLNVGTRRTLSTTVFGYLPDWEYLGGSYKYLRYDLLSHIACFDFGVSSSGSVTNPAGWPWSDLINTAHSNGVKVVMTAVNFKADEIHSILTNETAKNNFFNNVKNIIQTYNLDGINIDFEAMNSSDEGSVLNSFMNELTTFVHFQWPEKEVSIATPAVNWNTSWNFSGLAASCDYMFIMGYDFYGSWSTKTGPSAPLTGGTYNITNTVVTQYSAVTNSTPDKIILGVPYFGYHWTAQSGSAGATVIDGIGSVTYRSAEPSSQVYGLNWSSTYQTPWFAWNDGVWNQTWYDNDSSLGLKYDLADSKSLRGVGMWALGYDGERQELWNLLDIRYGSGLIPAPDEPQDFRVNVENDSTLSLVYSFPQRATNFDILISTDGETFEDTSSVLTDTVLVTGLTAGEAYYFKVRAKNSTGASAFTEVLGGVPGGDNMVLVVNGFDRTSGTENTKDFIKRYGPSIIKTGNSFASTSNEAVFKGLLNLNNFKYVFWMLGDESTADETLNQFEQDSLKSYLESGGRLFISGSEIGWDLSYKGSANDKAFYNNYLKAIYIKDAPNGINGTYYTCESVAGSFFESLADFNFDNGTHGTFDVDWPDAFKANDGAENILKFKNVSESAGYAGISYSGKFGTSSKNGGLVHLSVPFATIYPEESRDALMAKVFDFFDTAVGIKDNNEIQPNNFVLYQNYPNPFNPSTVIKFKTPEAGIAELTIYNILGQKVFGERLSTSGASEYQFTWNIKNSGMSISSGTYIYSIRFTGNDGSSFMDSKKMMLLK